MKTLAKQLLDIRDLYVAATGIHEFTLNELALWAIEKKHWNIDAAGTRRQFVAQLQRALRSEDFTDPQGRKVRKNYAAGRRSHGRQVFIWTDMFHASRDHMKVSLYDNRRRIVGDCRQLKMALDSYNQNWNEGDPIQMSWDFTRDLREAELAKATQRVSPDASGRSLRRFPVTARPCVSGRALSRP